MQHDDSQKIVALISKVFQRRKKFILASMLVMLAPILYYNETAVPTYHASTSLVFEEFANQVSGYNYDGSREIMISNRLEEIKSLGFSEDIVRALPPEVYEKFKNPKPDLDKFAYVSGKINRNIVAFSVRGSNVIEIGVELWDPELCMDIANTAAQVFRDRMFRVKQSGVGDVGSFIEEQLQRVKKELDDTEEELKSFKKVNRIISIQEESQGLLKKMTEAEVLYNSVQSTRGSLEERLAQIKQSLSDEKLALVDNITNITTPYAQALKDKLLALQQQHTDLRLQGYASDHPKMAQLQNDITETKKKLTDEALKIATSENTVDPLGQIASHISESYALQVDLEALKAQQAVLKKTIESYEESLSTLPEKEYVLARLTRQKEVMAKNYMMLLQKREEAELAKGSRLSSTRVIDEARLPILPIAPRKKLNLAIGIVLGLLIGFGSAFIRETTVQSIESAEELEGVTDWQVLASVPLIEKAANGRIPLIGRSKNGKHKSPQIKRSLVTEYDSKTPVAETYRMLRTNLQFNGLGKEYRTVMVTSIGPDEGKSTTLTNLGITLAKLDQKVLIVDSDLRRPQMHALFEVDKEPGLADLLVYHNAMKDDAALLDNSDGLVEKAFKDHEMGDLVDNFSDFVMDNKLVRKINTLAGMSNINILNSSLVEAVQSTYIENLKVLTSGKQLKNPSETVASMSMKALLDELKNKFNIVLIDSAPLLLVPETMVISSLVDGVIFVVDSQKYNKEMLLKAKSLLKKANAKVIGTVLNKVEVTSRNKDSYYYYDA